MLVSGLTSGFPVYVYTVAPERIWKWGAHVWHWAPDTRKIFRRVLHCFGSTSSIISRFGSFRNSLLLTSRLGVLRCSPWPAICKSGGTCPRTLWSRRHGVYMLYTNHWQPASAILYEKATRLWISKHFLCWYVCRSGRLNVVAAYRVAQKVNHYQESSLNRIKNRQCRYLSHQFWV